MSAQTATDTPWDIYLDNISPCSHCRYSPLRGRTPTKLEVIITYLDLHEYQLAELMGVSQPQVNYWVTGKYSIPTDRLVQLARVFNCSPSDIAGYASPDPPPLPTRH